MFKSTQFLVGVTLAAGVLLGYAAASGNFRLNRPAEAATCTAAGPARA